MEAKKTKRRFTRAGVPKRELGNEMLLLSCRANMPVRLIPGEFTARRLWGGRSSLAFSGKNS
jgi:hypothetical protein